MKSSVRISKIVLPLLMLLMCTISNAQTKYIAKNNLGITVSGTSTMHDWTMKSTIGECNAIFTFNESGNITGLTEMVFTTSVEGLKSGKSGMDKNAYEALKYKSYPSITYRLTSATVNPNGTITCRGALTIAGHTVNTDVVATCRPNANGSLIAVSGSKKISMKDYKIDPPSFMMGTIKTGNDIVLDFSFNLKK